MKLVLYGSFPASEAGRVARHLTSDWEVVPVFNEAPAQDKRERLADAEVMVTSVYRSRDPPAPRLRLLQCSSTGIERIDLEHLPRGCTVCNVHGHEIADLVHNPNIKGPDKSGGGHVQLVQLEPDDQENGE